MKKQLQLGLVVAGNSTGSAILRLPKLAEELGPIKSPALRTARRVSNFLKAGYAVPEYEDLANARLILMHLPDSVVTRVVDELCASELVFKKLSFVLCESWLTSDVLKPLSARGASTATLVKVPSARRNWFVIEGQLSAVRQMRRVLERNEALTLELRPGTKHLYFAAELLARALPMPLYMTAQEALRDSGLSGNRLHALIDEMAHDMFRRFLKGAAAAWRGAANECPPETAENYLRALREDHPQIAEVVDMQLLWARRKMSRPRERARAMPGEIGVFREAASP
ncbi:MAG: hypothetical protein JO097_21920 [Acidobacteriaceae bacterium]|nr:hypothetical protein [Acidobacteriaceae bacterium]MBV9296437.1 hypothetical protein [Acidobacteriaceae bacterium]MBV9767558.1 hypothetical protein [Acidobacteriaceae bacterium]